MSDQDRTSHPVDKFIHALYGKTEDRFSGYGKYSDKVPSFGEVMDYIDENGPDYACMGPFHQLRNEYLTRGIGSLGQHPFRGQSTLSSVTVYHDAAVGEINQCTECGHPARYHLIENEEFATTYCIHPNEGHPNACNCGYNTGR